MSVVTAMHALAVELDLRFPNSRSLKDKRAVLRPVLEGVRNRFPVAVAEVDHQDLWQRAAIGLAAVSASPSHAEQLIDGAERFVWSFPDIEVLGSVRRWLDGD